MGEKKKKVDNYQPLVSIVTPVHNGERFFVDTINTVCSQTYKNWEWIIVDDASTDGTLKTFEEVRAKLSKEGKLLGKIIVIELDKNGGAAKARNKGIEIANGEYLCFLDADDLWVPEKLEKQIAFMKKKNCAFSFTGYEFADAEGRPNGKVVSVPNAITYRQALRNTTIWTSTVMFDMEKLSKNDVLMPDIASEDTATWWNVLKKVETAEGIDEPMSFYRRSGKTLSSNKFVAIQRIWNLYRKHEKLNPVQSSLNFVGYAFNAVRRRV